MPYVFQSISKLTGKAHPLWRFQYVDYLGRQKKGTGATTRKETEKIAAQVQAHQYAIKNRVAPAPKASDVARKIEELIEEYLRWGVTQGGRRGHPWGPEHARKRISGMAFWKKELKLQTQLDLIDSQTRVERIIHRIHIISGRSGKTTWGWVETLAAFCRWCVDRGYLEDDPLRRLKPINTDPVYRRRPLEADEIVKLLQNCLPERVLLYETAICSGLRANELRNITPEHLDVFRCGIRLDARWTKNRLDGFQPLPKWLLNKLVAAAAGLHPATPMFSVQKSHAARMLRDDLERAGIQAFKPGLGMVVFHSLRMSYCTLLDEHGASAKENQQLARHATPEMTMNRYVRTRETHVRDVVEALGAAVNAKPPTQQEPNGLEAVKLDIPKAL